MSINKYTLKRLTKDCNYKEFLELLEELTFVDSSNISYDDFCKQYDKLNTEIYIVIDNLNDKIIATGSVLIEHKFIHKLGSVAHIEDIVVNKNYRGYGIGKIIINHLIDIAKKNNCYKIILNSSNDNTEFYKKFGFTIKDNHMAYYI